MKTISITKSLGVALGFATLLSTSFMSCQKESLSSDSNGKINPEVAGKVKPPIINSNCTGYNVTLDKTADAISHTTTFIWSIQNPNPGSGSGTTIQNLSHWTFIPGCPGNNGLEQNWADIVSAAYNTGAGWVEIVPVPDLKPDPSQTCTSANVFKFNFGTSGTTATQYRLVLSGNYGTADNQAFFKSGSSTGCCEKTILGIGCKVEETCSLSQGYYFAKPGPTWPTGMVSVGGFTYTEAEGRAIWNCSNAGGIGDSKKAFTQVAALMLSGAYPTGNAQIDADVVTIQTYLSALGQKLVACSYLPTGTVASAPAAAAAGRIGTWISNNHCAD